MSIQDHLEPNDFVVIIRPMREAYTEVDPNLALIQNQMDSHSGRVKYKLPSLRILVTRN